MYARQVAGQVLTFGVSGKLIMNGLVMYDRETDSLWSQVIGRAVDGRLSGTELTMLPALQTTWDRWASTHPDTVVLDKSGRYRFDSYTGYYTDSSLGIHGQTRSDDRLGPKELVLGVDLPGQAKAYPFRVLDRASVVNDSIGGVSLLITYDPASETGVVFDPTVDGELLIFRELRVGGEFLMEDLVTGTVWDPFTGAALEGPLKGATLEQIPSHYEFWFSWSDYRPSTLVYEGPADNG